ncbi:uncharacterized protein K460DRAFT_417524 [Cucurbitaria berberidis CBS 394.84]|uniref:Uncharacterized protein n=1 Tax=Cucurbitaria berberidis CBS 394.84 TaxID=1168544 RepID=A0A9P4GJN6_9PLEO|nr:uncharacterized protein K460DRAFT_417524 [Cucurbitaria berberidis CBS 394.84]KAF1846444.1 hypothetical protein K460DRAFT_417524 [Cucurbitaria berberidis CBS 394.84]
MSLNVIREYIADDAERLLDSLPLHSSMSWIPFSAAEPPIALVLGTVDGYYILAFLVRLRGRPSSLAFCQRRIKNSGDQQRLQQDQVMQYSLNAPFKYNTDVSRTGEIRFSLVILWYFLAKELIDSAFNGNDTEKIECFHDALKRIDLGQRTEKGSQREDQSTHERQTPPMIEDSPEPERPKTPYSFRSRERGRNRSNADARETTNEKLSAELETLPPADASEEENSDLRKLIEHLRHYSALYLLDNLTEPERIPFENQDRFPEAQPKKLSLGKHAKTHDAIYAYMRPRKGPRAYHEINFFVEGKRYHVGTSIEQSDTARLTLIVKWYFIVAGIAKDVVLRETKAYPERFKAALEFIAERMGSAAATAPIDTSPCLEPDDIEPDGTEPAPISTTPPPASLPTTRPNTPLQLSDAQTPSQGTKRTAEDAEFECLEQIFSQNTDLTNQINEFDQKLDIHDVKRANFMEKWEKELDDMLAMRDQLDAERRDLRRSFKRRSKAFAENYEDD